ncbi:MAG: hypothetical protein HN855_01435 [Anaerolineae bacterium]|jgi:hypothetical protein|nr:hypothetical protein [Anaerolineae bacterium]MBT7072799.1 hypothetical protein [Anaerolineae bacterium]MBT7323802.1 hypothetical protein [Anaerolineae bacterium]
MKKSGLIIGGIGFVFSLAVTLLSPILLPCITPILGIAAGYMADIFDLPLLKSDAIKKAAKAGALGGVGMLVGQVIGAIINGVAVGPEGVVMVLSSFGIPAGSPAALAKYYWTMMFVGTACISLFNIALMAGLGALGGLIWWEANGKEKAAKAQITESEEV